MHLKLGEIIVDIAWQCLGYKQTQVLTTILLHPNIKNIFYVCFEQNQHTRLGMCELHVNFYPS